MITPEFTKEEQKVRKTWFRLFVVTNLPFVLFGFFFLIGCFFLKGLVALVCIPILVLLFFIGPYPIYHCAYKNQGIIWLTITLVCAIIGLVCSIASLFLNCSQNPNIIFEWPYSFMCVSDLLTLWWIFVSFKLRKINKKYGNIDFSEQEYADLTLQIQTAANVEELEKHLHTAVQAIPQLERHFSRAYQKRKEELLQESSS